MIHYWPSPPNHNRSGIDIQHHDLQGRVPGKVPQSCRRKRGQIELARVSRTGLSDGSQAPKTPKENVLPIDLRGLGTAAFVWLTPRQVVKFIERIQPSSYLMVAELETDSVCPRASASSPARAQTQRAASGACRHGPRPCEAGMMGNTFTPEVGCATLASPQQPQRAAPDPDQ